MSASLLIAVAKSGAAITDPHEEFLERICRMERRCARERSARHEAERLLEIKSLELLEIHRRLLRLNEDLEARVASRTASLSNAKKAALQLVEVDYLTKLASRYQFHKQLERTFEHAAASEGRIALLLIDIDGFKAINDTYGHGYGDELLVQVAARLTVVARRRDLVSRLGGDELAIVIEDSGTDEAGAAAERILESFRSAFTIDGVTIHCTASIGIACFPEHAHPREELQRAADLAL